MFDSNTLASFALVISIVSFWLSYITFRQNARRVSAEKRTEALIALRKTSIWLTELLEQVKLAENTKQKTGAELHVRGIAANINNEMEKVISGFAHDTVLLEHVKAYATDIGELTNHLAPKIIDSLVGSKLATDVQIEQANAAVQEAVKSANDLLATLSASKFTNEMDATFKQTVEDIVAELVRKMTTTVNEILTSDELSNDSILRCNKIANDFTDGMNELQNRWKASHC